MSTAEGSISNFDTPYLPDLEAKELLVEIQGMFQQLLALSGMLKSEEDYQQKHAPVLAMFLDLKLGKSPAFKSINPDTLDIIRRSHVSMAGLSTQYYRLYTQCQAAVMSYLYVSGNMPRLMDYDEQHLSDQFAAIAGGHLTTDHLLAEVSAEQVDEIAIQTRERLSPTSVSPGISAAA